MTTPVDAEKLLAGMTDREVAAWLILDTAIRRHVALGARYAAIPHPLLRLLGAPAYPTEDLAPVFDPGGRHCGLAGFWRDEASGVDWWCLLPYEHDGRHGWEVTSWAVRDAVAQGYRPELDDADLADDEDLLA